MFFRHHIGIFGLLLPLLWVLLVVGLIIWAVRSSKPSSSALPTSDPALQELRLRYARGELTREEFVQRNVDLGGSGPPPPPG